MILENQFTVGADIDAPDVVPLLPDAAEAGYAALKQRGLYPINHLVVVRDELLHEHPDLGVLVLSQHVETTHVVDLVRHGGFGYLLKDRVLDVGDFLDAAERVARGGSALDPEVVAVGGFHGGGLVTDAEDSPHRGLSTARAEFVFGHADHDRSMGPEAIETLGESLRAAGLTASNEVYEGAAHGYTMADTSVYDEAATERHFEELRALLTRTL